MRILFSTTSVLHHVLLPLRELDVLCKRMGVDSTHALAVRAVTFDRSPLFLAFRLLLEERRRKRYCILDRTAVTVEIVAGRDAVRIGPGHS